MSVTLDLRKHLVRWFRQRKRDLPWRQSRDPYRIWVSEIMLQQTRVDTVVGYFNRFMKRFPTVEALAAAPIDDVLKLWQGLGYYARARNLHRAAQHVAAEHEGVVPADEKQLRSLPGLGPYTVGAIRSIAFGQPAPLVDGNVIRVLSRLFEIEGDPSRSAVQRRFWEVAGGLVDPDNPGDFNEGLMELGATVCTPTSPQCADCPVRMSCEAHANGTVERYPTPKTRAKVRNGRAACAAVIRRGRILLARRRPDGLLGGLWELPTVECKGREKPETALARGLPMQVGLAVSTTEPFTEVTHQYSHLHMTYAALRCRAQGRARPRDRYDKIAWVPLSEMDGHPTGMATTKMLAAL